MSMAKFHTSTPLHTATPQVWNVPKPHFHTTTPLGGVGVWCGRGCGRESLEIEKTGVEAGVEENRP